MRDRLDLSTLNPQQREAVETTEGPLLVLAGAGSGKTRVITFRIAWLLARNVAAKRILAVSFTNKAATEMRERVMTLVGPAAREVVLSTFHALGVRFLREEPEACGLSRKFSILDEADQLDAVRTVLRRLGFDLERYEPKQVLARISHYKNKLEPPRAGDHPVDGVVVHILPHYERRLRAMNAVDFDDLIGLPVRVMETNEEVAARWACRFRYVMVDEYQDTNNAQLRMIRALVRGHGNLCVVGDDDQSIYAWRGAVARNILDFANQFVGARVVKLTQNYRSTNSILRCANAVIGHNADRHGKTLWSDKGDGDRVRYKLCDDGEAEAEWIAADILRRGHADERRWSEIGVLYRTNAQARMLEDGLRRARVPYRIVGGTKFFDRKEVRDVLAYLRVIANSYDEAALRRIINYPARGIGDTTIERLTAHARARDIPFFRAVAAPDDIGGVGPKAVAALRGFDALVRRYRAAFDGKPLGDACRALVGELGIANELIRTTRDVRQARQRLENVAEIADALDAYRARRPDSGLEDYLALLALDSRRDEDEEKQTDEVTLMTLHSAKGLEFPVVYLAGAEEGLMPHKRVLEGDGDVAEERRLAYVGITRAQERLTVTGAKKRLRFGRVQHCRPSRFLCEIPEDLLDGGRMGQPDGPSEEEQRQNVKRAFDAMSNLFD